MPSGIQPRFAARSSTWPLRYESRSGLPHLKDSQSWPGVEIELRHG